MTPQEIHARLSAEFEEAIEHFEAEAAQPWIQVDPMRLDEIVLFLREESDLDCDRLLLVSGIDWEGLDENGKGKHRAISRYADDGTAEPAGPVGTGDLGVTYHLQSRQHMHQVVLKVRLPREGARVKTLSHIHATAQWGERETYDFYGIEFAGHPDLRRMFLPEDWEGWPLRKDYAMPTVYHDVPLEGLPLATREKQREGGE